jgi:hypothetical protein
MSLVNPERNPRAAQGDTSASAWLLLALCLSSQGCATLGDRGPTLVPTRYQVRTGPFLIYSNTAISADSPAVRCLHSLETDLTSRLAYHARPGEDPVEIYILNDRNAYTHFLKFYYPELPSRRAFFLAQGDRRVVYTYLSDRLEEDLRHEAAHALIRGCYGDLPLWLDEGLAEYFETGSAAGIVPDEHLARIPDDRKAGWVPDLPRLESLTDIHQMTPRDYRESWAWVHLMLEGSKPGSSLLIDYLKQGRDGPRTEPLSQLLAASGTTGKTLLSHLDSAQSSLLAKSHESPATEPLYRFQDRGADSHERSADPAIVPVAAPAPSPPPRPSLLRRIGAWLGL